VAPYQAWNWAGDEIVYDCIVPAARLIPGTKKRYPIDIREYLSTPDNAVIRETVRGIVSALDDVNAKRFVSKEPGSFDYRVSVLLDYMMTHLRYRDKPGFDHWLFPDETQAQKAGDCEDLAFLLAALLSAAGMSNYCVRVALGFVRVYQPGAPMIEHAHAWVMYLNERGRWELLEPFAHVNGRPRPRPARKNSIARMQVSNVTYNFSTRSNRCAHPLDEVQQHWNETVVTGHWWRPIIGVPSEIANEAEFAWRLCLPDHNHLAVDSFAGWTADHHYDLQTYQQQFVLRRKMAIRHVRAIYQEWMQAHP